MANSKTIEEIGRITYDAADLVQRHPANVTDSRKRLLVDGIQVPISGTVQVTRWMGKLPESVTVKSRPHLEMREDVFSYEQASSDTTAWQVNFAAERLFGAYGSRLFAQDEHQCLEHPVLGSLREALLALEQSRPELAPRTREERPTPIAIKGVQRSICFDTVNGPYGNDFISIELEKVLMATSYLDPPTYSNILAMRAPSGGYGRYTRLQIADVLETAFVGFSAAKAESEGLGTVIHTGNWGCGAFGGNPRLMALLQLCAAQLAEVETVIYHTVSAANSAHYREAWRVLPDLVGGLRIDVAALLGRIDAMAFEWGMSNGT